MHRPYTREQAAYPLPWLRETKFWPTVSRIDDGVFAAASSLFRLLKFLTAYGDLNLIVRIII